jgi:hypothetical protein
MAEIVNLNRVKKSKAKAADQAEAAANRTKHGRTTAEKARDALVEAQRNALLDGVRKDS